MIRRREALWSGSYFLDPPVVDDASIFCSNKDSHCVRLDRRSLRDIWRVSSDGYYLVAAIGGQLVMSNGRGGIAAVCKESGRTKWRLERSPFFGASPWRDALLLFSDAVEVIDPASGLVLDRIDLPGGPLAGRAFACGDTVLEVGAQVRAYDLGLRKPLWSRSVSADVETRFGVNHGSDRMSFSAASKADRLIVSWRLATSGLRLSDGELLWHVPVGFEYGVPRSANGLIHVLHAGRSYLVDEGTGVIAANHDYDEVLERCAWGVWSGVLYGGNIAYTMSSSLAAVFSMSTGELVSWCHYRRGLGVPALAAPHLVATGVDGWLVVFGDQTAKRQGAVA